MSGEATEARDRDRGDGTPGSGRDRDDKGNRDNTKNSTPEEKYSRDTRGLLETPDPYSGPDRDPTLMERVDYALEDLDDWATTEFGEGSDFAKKAEGFLSKNLLGTIGTVAGGLLGGAVGSAPGAAIGSMLGKKLMGSWAEKETMQTTEKQPTSRLADANKEIGPTPTSRAPSAPTPGPRPERDSGPGSFAAPTTPQPQMASLQPAAQMSAPPQPQGYGAVPVDMNRYSQGLLHRVRS